MEETKRFTIGKKLFIFVTATVLFSTACVCALNYFINVDQVNTYYKRLTVNNAKNYATLVDADFIRDFRAVLETDEYQALRRECEDLEDDAPIREYFIDAGIWDRFVEERERMRTYLGNMEDVEYLYVVAWDEHSAFDGAFYDMYVIDADDVPLYNCGYYELRESEFGEVDYTKTIQPVITTGDWGWLCSGYEPVYVNGEIICHVGCDISMEEVMAERYSDLAYMIISAVVVTVISLIGAFIFVNHNVVKPIKAITEDMQKFSPAPGKDYIEAGVTNIYISREDEIGDIYGEIQTMQKNLVDYINDITTIRKDKEEAEESVRIKDQELGEISKEAFHDALTGIGNLNAYRRKAEELNGMIGDGKAEFAVVMMDANGLKNINDNYGHAEGDAYLKGNCNVICGILKNSPVFRIGGDEFVSVLEGVDYEQRDELVKTLRKTFAETYKKKKVQPWERYSVSVGMSVFESDDKTVDDVFKRADKIMYEVKEEFKRSNILTK